MAQNLKMVSNLQQEAKYPILSIKFWKYDKI
jgi:hypothetical protein